MIIPIIVPQMPITALSFDLAISRRSYFAVKLSLPQKGSFSKIQGFDVLAAAGRSASEGCILSMVLQLKNAARAHIKTIMSERITLFASYPGPQPGTE